MQTKVGIRLTKSAILHLSAWHAEEPTSLFRIQASPLCGSPGGNWSLTAVDKAWNADTVVTIEGIPFVYSSFLEYLMDDVEVDWEENEAEDYEGPVFRLNSAQGQGNIPGCP